jgi:hypothetical protein
LVVLFASAALRVTRGARGLGAQPDLVAAFVAYVVWAALGQNTAYKPRHLLPIAPILMVALAAGADALIARARAMLAVPIIVVIAWFYEGLSLVRIHREPSPAAAIVHYLRDASDDRPVLTSDLARMIAEGAPSRRVLGVTEPGDVTQAVDAHGREGVLLTTEALTPALGDALRARGVAVSAVFSRPRSRYVDSLWWSLALVELRTP